MLSVPDSYKITRNLKLLTDALNEKDGASVIQILSEDVHDIKL